MEYIQGDLIGSEPITTAEVKQWLRLDYCDTTEISTLITSARQAAENYCNTDFVIKKYSVFADFLPREFRSVKIPVTEITSATIYHSDNTFEEITDYVLASGNRIIRQNETAITDIRSYDAIEFAIQCGYTAVTEKVKEAMLWHCYNSYYKADVSMWLPAFHSLLSTIRNRPA